MHNNQRNLSAGTSGSRRRTFACRSGVAQSVTLALLVTGSTAAWAQSDPLDPSVEGSDYRQISDALAVDQQSEWTPGVEVRRSPDRLESLLDAGESALASGNLLDPSSGALAHFRQVLSLDQGNATATRGLSQVANRLAQRARSAYDSGDRAAASELLGELSGINPNHPEVTSLTDNFVRDDQLADRLARAAAALEENNLVGEDGALDAYRAALDVFPGHLAATEGLAGLERLLLARAADAMREDAFDAARDLIAQAETVRGDPQEQVMQHRLDLENSRSKFFERRRDTVSNLIDQGRYPAAERALEELLTLGYSAPVNALKERIAIGYTVSRFEPFSVLREAVVGDVMELKIMPRGEFAMGSNSNEAGRSEREGPVREIQFPLPFAILPAEVTVAQFRQFVEATGYVTDAEKAGSSRIFDTRAAALVDREGINWEKDFRGRNARSSHPVLHVSWNDANAYAKWLSAETGKTFRLPSEAEFEYALRGGTSTRYWWGDDTPPARVENLRGVRDRLDDLRWPDGFDQYGDSHWGTAPAASYDENPFGLFDMGGNASEWVGDCYVNNLTSIPAQGGASEVGGCDKRVVRGASWASPPRAARTAYRNAAAASHTSSLIGFRVVREL
ncbi:MAG: formylglycine-generating enzyme family protein [Pseudomonadota bacterium]